MFVLFFQNCDSSVVKANCTIPWLQQLQNQEHCNCVMLFHWLSGEDLSLQERHRALQHAWLLWQRWIMQLSSRCLCPRLERVTATCHLGVGPSWTQSGSVERETSRKRGQSWSDWILPSAPEMHEDEQTEKHWQIWQMLKELLWSCYETAMELLKNAHKTQQDTSVSNCEIPVAFRYYLCTDSSGLSVGMSRVVEVGCEGPNPSGSLM